MKIKNIQHINQALIRKQLLKEGFVLEVEKNNDSCGYFWAYTRPYKGKVEWIMLTSWVNQMEIPWYIEREILSEGVYIQSYFNGCPEFVDEYGARVPWGHDGRISFREGEDEEKSYDERNDISVCGYFPHTGMRSLRNFEKGRERDFTGERVVDAKSILAKQGIAPGKGKLVIGWSNPFRS